MTRRRQYENHTIRKNMADALRIIAPDVCREAQVDRVMKKVYMKMVQGTEYIGL